MARLLLAFAIILCCIFSASLVYGHSVDDLCLPGQDTEDGCQPKLEYLCLDNPEFYRAQRAYWHERRELVADMIRYATLVGEATAEYRNCRYKQGIVFPAVDVGLLTYWDRVPARPDLDFRCAAWRADEQTRAAVATRGAAAEATKQLLAKTAIMVADCKVKPKKRKRR